MQSGTFGPTNALQKHVGKKTTKYSTPAPGNYSPSSPDSYKMKKCGSSSFGGPLAKMDRSKTGYLAESQRFKAPAPGQYNANSGFQKQVGSTKSSSANFKFGSSTRDDIHIVYTPGLSQEGSSRQTPGPGSYANTSHNKICRKAGKKTAPTYSFGGNLAKVKRGGVGSSTSTLPQCGPGSYGASPSVGGQVNSLKKTAARANFGTADRTRSEVAVQPGYAGKSKGVRDNPGPGAYSAMSSIGKQSDAKKPSSFNFKFGTEVRSKADALRNRDIYSTPGPGAYQAAPGNGVQMNSRFASSSRTLFGTSERSSLSTPVG